MTATIKATARIESDGSALLVFHGTRSNAYDAECYIRKDGHNGLSRAYYNKCTTAPHGPDDEAQVSRLVAHYDALPGDGRVRLVHRMDWSAKA